MNKKSFTLTYNFESHKYIARDKETQQVIVDIECKVALTIKKMGETK
jgi:hypothetical protein